MRHYGLMELVIVCVIQTVGYYPLFPNLTVILNKSLPSQVTM